MRIKLLKGVVINGEPHITSDEVDAIESEAKYLIRIGKAIEIKPKTKVNLEK